MIMLGRVLRSLQGPVQATLSVRTLSYTKPSLLMPAAFSLDSRNLICTRGVKCTDSSQTLSTSSVPVVRHFGIFSREMGLIQPSLLTPAASNLEQIRTYKVRVVLKRRCKGCYFEKRLGRWYVECTLKPRHKQMQVMGKKDIFKDDYSKGNIRVAANWGWQKKRIYWKGDQMEKDFYKPLIDYRTTTVQKPS